MHVARARTHGASPNIMASGKRKTALANQALAKRKLAFPKSLVTTLNCREIVGPSVHYG